MPNVISIPVGLPKLSDSFNSAAAAVGAAAQALYAAQNSTPDPDNTNNTGPWKSQTQVADGLNQVGLYYKAQAAYFASQGC